MASPIISHIPTLDIELELSLAVEAHAEEYN